MSKSYIQGSVIDAVSNGSLERAVDNIHSAIDDYFGESSVNIVATHSGYAYAISEDGNPLKVTFESLDDGSVRVKSAKPTKAIKIIEDDEVTSHVARELRSIVESMMKGTVSRTQVREVASLLQKDEDYWMSGILHKLDEMTGETSEWLKMYEANTERIRTSLYGRIREIEARGSSTAYLSLPNASEFSEELKLSVGRLKTLCLDIFDESEKMVFDTGEDFLCTVCESLKVEAQAVGAMLGKAEKLFEASELPQVAAVHDKIANRAKTMAIVSEYLKTKAQEIRSEDKCKK